MQEEPSLQDLQSMVLALTQERLLIAKRPKNPRLTPSRRQLWEAAHPTVTFRVDLEIKDLFNRWRQKTNLSYSDIAMVGLERLERLELIKVLKKGLVKKLAELKKELAERISVGRKAIAMAKQRGIDISGWEASLAALEQRQKKILQWEAALADLEQRQKKILQREETTSP